MGVAAIQPVSTGLAGGRRAPQTVASRRELAVLQALGRPLAAHDPALIRQTAAQTVSELFYVPLLAQMRQFPFGSELGLGGRGEAVFAERLDQQLADAVTAAERDGLVDQIAGRLEDAAQRVAAPAAQSAAATVPPARPTQPSARAPGPALTQVSWLPQLQAQKAAEACDHDS
jgi:Rod binding domain-containing protein